MSYYVDGFILSIAEDKVEDYKKMADMGCKVWMKHGALAYFECKGDDLSPQMGDVKMAKFPEMAGTKDGEITFFSFIIFKSREHRDEVNKKVMEDQEMNEFGEECAQMMPFDVERMAYGGFESIVSMFGKIN